MQLQDGETSEYLLAGCKTDGPALRCRCFLLVSSVDARACVLNNVQTCESPIFFCGDLIFRLALEVNRNLSSIVRCCEFKFLDQLHNGASITCTPHCA